MKLLDITDVRILEDMVIECIYYGLLSGKLDNKQQQLITDYTTSRDFKIEDASKLFNKLEVWTNHINKVENILDKNLKDNIANLEKNEKRIRKLKTKADEVYSKALAEIEFQQAVGKPNLPGTRIQKPLDPDSD